MNNYYNDGLTIRVETPFVYGGTNNSKTTVDGNSNNKKTAPKDSKGNTGAFIAVQIAKKVGYGVASRIGSYTDRYLTTNKINMAFSIVGGIASFAASPYLFLAQAAVSTAFSIADDIIATNSANAQSAYVRELAGISSVYSNGKKGI